MNEQLTREAAALSQALHLLLCIAAVGVAHRPDHDQLCVFVLAQHPLGNVRDVVDALLLDPAAHEDEDACLGVLRHLVLPLDHGLGRDAARQVLLLAALHGGHALGLRHAVLDAAHLGQAPEHRVLLRRLEGVVPRHGADAAASLVPARVVHDGLQHAELPLVERLAAHAVRGQVEDLGEPIGLLLAHVLRGNRALVLRVMEDYRHREWALNVHHGHGGVEVGAVVHVRLRAVDQARHGLVPQRVELDGALPRLRRGVDLLALAEKLMVDKVEGDGRRAGLAAGLRLLTRDVVAIDLARLRLAAHDDMQRLFAGREGVGLVAHARVHADEGAGVVLAQEPGHLAQAAGHSLLDAALVGDDVLQRGDEDGVRLPGLDLEGHVHGGLLLLGLAVTARGGRAGHELPGRKGDLHDTRAMLALRADDGHDERQGDAAGRHHPGDVQRALAQGSDTRRRGIDRVGHVLVVEDHATG
mmetsp:Transcript_46810/g.121220  ORF Transcript_46810/g.121220 Transcript_46810/m.121220 type:complete len:471 (+) Transcript_46810:2715-4127(+)